MKHPALTRVFAIVLLLMALIMGFAGWLGLTRAEKDRRNVADDMARVRGRIEEYRVAEKALSGSVSYDEREEELERRQERHDKDASEHRTDLNTYTLTQYGIAKGTEAMDAADAEFNTYKAMFEGALGSYRQAMGMVNELMGQLWQLYNAAAGVLDNANGHLAYANGVVASLDAGETVTTGQLVEAYDQLLLSVDEAAALYATLHELQPTLDALAAFDPASLSALADGMGQLPNSLGALSGFSLDAYAESGVDFPLDLTEFMRLKDGFNQAWATIKEVMAGLDAAIPQIEAQVQAATGMNVAELRRNAQAGRDALAAQEDAPLDAETGEAILAMYADNREAIQGALGEANARMNEINGYAAQVGSFLTTVQGQLDAVNGMMARAEEMISQAENALYYSRAMIWWQMGQQSEKEQELRERKEQLDQESEQLQELADAAEEQKTAEKRLRSLRAILMSRDGIRMRVDAGEELTAAASAYASESETSAEESYQVRRKACQLMLAGAVCALFGMPAAFEQIRSRFLLLFPVLLCLGCAVGAEYLFRTMGRGDSYSALAAAGFAAIQFLVSAPKRKRGRKKKRTV